MLFKVSSSVTAGTTADTFETQVLKVNKGLLDLWVVWVTQESANFLNLRVLYHGVQVYPFTMGQTIKAWFVPIPVNAKLKIDTPPYELVVEAWNTAPTNPHEYHVHCNVEPARPVTVGEPDTSILGEMWHKIFGG